MRKTIATPIKAFKDGTADKYGHKSLTADEIADREKTDAEHDNFINENGYKLARIAEYPSIGDQLDEVWRALAVLKSLPDSTKEMIEKIIAVKENNPKPGKVE